MRSKAGYFVELPNSFSVQVPNQSVPEDDYFLMRPSGIYITYNHARAWLHYAGDQAGESHATFEIPSDPAYLRKLAKELTKLAKVIDEEKDR